MWRQHDLTVEEGWPGKANGSKACCQRADSRNLEDSWISSGHHYSNYCLILIDAMGLPMFLSFGASERLANWTLHRAMIDMKSMVSSSFCLTLSLLVCLPVCVLVDHEESTINYGSSEVCETS